MGLQECEYESQFIAHGEEENQHEFADYLLKWKVSGAFAIKIYDGLMLIFGYW